MGSAIHRCWLGFYEFEKQRLISSMVKTGTVFYDVGANVGFYCLLAAGLVGPQGQVFAFEPLPRNVAYLRRHLALYRASNVEILELALGEQTGTASFTPEPSGCMGRLSHTGCLPVTVASLDDLLEQGRLVPRTRSRWTSKARNCLPCAALKSVSSDIAPSFSLPRTAAIFTPPAAVCWSAGNTSARNLERLLSTAWVKSSPSRERYSPNKHRLA